MNLVTALIQPFMVDRLSRALIQISITGFTVSDARGYGQAPEGQSDYLTPRSKFEIAVLEEHTDLVVNTIINCVSTHQRDDGMIFVTQLTGVVNIRTSARNREALTALVD